MSQKVRMFMGFMLIPVLIIVVGLSATFLVEYVASNDIRAIATDSVVSDNAETDAEIASINQQISELQKRSEKLYKACRHDGRLLLDQDHGHKSVTCARCSKILYSSER